MNHLSISLAGFASFARDPIFRYLFRTCNQVTRCINESIEQTFRGSARNGRSTFVQLDADDCFGSRGSESEMRRRQQLQRPNRVRDSAELLSGTELLQGARLFDAVESGLRCREGEAERESLSAPRALDPHPTLSAGRGDPTS